MHKVIIHTLDPHHTHTHTHDATIFVIILGVMKGRHELVRESALQGTNSQHRQLGGPLASGAGAGSDSLGAPVGSPTCGDLGWVTHPLWNSLCFPINTASGPRPRGCCEGQRTCCRRGDGRTAGRPVSASGSLAIITLVGPSFASGKPGFRGTHVCKR